MPSDVRAQITHFASDLRKYEHLQLLDLHILKTTKH